MQKKEQFRMQLQKVICNISRWLLWIRSQEIAKADGNFPSIIAEFEKLLAYPEMMERKNEILDNFSLVLDAYQQRDYVLAGDYMQMGILSFLQNGVENWMSQWEEKKDESGYQLEYTSSAALTLAKEVGQKRIYLHSNNNPWEEAEIWAKTNGQDGIERYHVAGLALGYHVISLASNPLVQVIVYEEDKEVIQYAKQCPEFMEYFDLYHNIRILHDSDYVQFAEAVANLDEEIEKIALYHPSLQTIKNRNLRDKMKDLFLQYNNTLYWNNNFSINFRYNTKQIKKGIDELEKKIKGKRVYLIAGGPSLDKNIALLKRREKDSIVITVGTSLKKCIREEIEPDYVIITDPKPGVLSQIQGTEQCGIPMILLSTSYAHVCRDYLGDKYLLCQKGYREAEEYAKEKSWKLVKTGGSVVTTALDLCICCRVKEVVFLGLDLAFTDGKTHHSGAYSEELQTATTQVLDVYGNLVGTSGNLAMYHKWIENRIAEAIEKGCQIKFYDATEGGALVQGTEVISLQELLCGKEVIYEPGN